MSEEKKNEVATKEENTQVVPTDMFQTEITQEDEANLSSGNKWITSLSIAYPMAPMVQEGKARPGEFVFGGKEALGNSIDVIVFNLRHHIAYQDPNDGYKQKEHFYFKRGQGDIKKNEGYKEFCRNLPSGMKLLEGPDVFMYIPSLCQFAVFYMKQTLKYSASDLLNAGQGGRLVNISSVLTKGKKHNYYTVSSVPKGQAASNSTIKDPAIQKNINVPMDKFVEFCDLFDNPNRGVEFAEQDAAKFER